MFVLRQNQLMTFYFQNIFNRIVQFQHTLKFIVLMIKTIIRVFVVITQTLFNISTFMIEELKYNALRKICIKNTVFGRFQYLTKIIFTILQYRLKNMTKPISAEIFLGIMISFILIASAYCDSDSFNTAIDAAIQQKQNNLAQKNTAFQYIDSTSNALKLAYLDLAQTKTGAADAYRNFFIQNSKCEGNDGHLDILSGVTGTIPDDICLQAPITADAHDYFLASLQLQDLQENTQYYQYLVDEQQRFNTDYFAEQAVYTKLRQTAWIPLQDAAQQSRDCIAQYATEQNPNPPECQELQDKTNYFASYYEFYRGKELSFGRMSKIPIFSLDGKKTKLQNATQQQTDYKSSIQGKIDSLKTVQDQCQQTLYTSRTLINQRLKAALDSSNNANVQEDKIQTLLNSLNSLLQNSKSSTLQIKDLANNIKNVYP